MKEHPILFSGPMVRAILEGRKTQTRRIVKGRKQPWDDKDCLQECKAVHPDGTGHGFVFWRNGLGSPEFTKRHYPEGGWQCPYGKPGDRLWVRETFALEATDKLYPWHLDGRPHQQGDNREEFSITVPCYRATDEDYGLTTEEQFDEGDTRTRWKPSIHMPRWASRITLEVVSVRVERLRDISEEDAIAEGVKTSGVLRVFENPIMEYHHLWNTINGEGAWDANPWVWVVEFKRILP